MSPSDEHLGTSDRAQIGGRKSARGNGVRQSVGANGWPRIDGPESVARFGGAIRWAQCSAIVRWSQGRMVSTRDVVSVWSCGQDGPLLSTATRRGWWWRDWAKYGAPESYRQ